MRIAGIRFRENWKVYDFDATEVIVAVGDAVIVDSDRGPGFARVVRLRTLSEPDPVEAAPLEAVEPGDAPKAGEAPAAAPVRAQAPKVLRKILRKATADDIGREDKNKAREAEAFTAGLEMIAEREMPMKLIRVEYSFDASKATFYFFSETRIDFRELVKDLAYKLRSRIEMRQVGVRDVARMIGGFGPCGRELCCSAFLTNFEPVSIRMAKKQDMVLNPAKISGVCGRLLCCLSYEYEMYDDIKKDVASMRESVVKEKRAEEEQRISEERKDAEERRLAEEKRRQEERKQAPEPRREKQKDNRKKGAGKPEKKREAPQEKKTQPQPEQVKKRPPQPKQEQLKQDEPATEQAAQPSPEGEKSGRKNRRRFWRRKKKGQQGESKPQGPGPEAT